VGDSGNGKGHRGTGGIQRSCPPRWFDEPLIFHRCHRPSRCSPSSHLSSSTLTHSHTLQHQPSALFLRRRAEVIPHDPPPSSTGDHTLHTGHPLSRPDGANTIHLAQWYRDGKNPVQTKRWTCQGQHSNMHYSSTGSPGKEGCCPWFGQSSRSDHPSHSIVINCCHC